MPPQSAPATRAPKAADNSSKWLTIKDDWVTECDKSAKGHIVIPDGVTEIGENAFEDCTSLASVSIPTSVTKIGKSAFSGCKALASVTIPKGITEIGYDAFEDCTSLESVEFGGTMAEWEKVKGKYDLLKDIPAKSVKCADGEWEIPSILVEDGEVVGCLDKTVTSIVIPDGVTKIGGGAFTDCTSLASVTIPDSVTYIYWNAFDGCDSLHEIHVRGTPSKELKKKFGLFGWYRKIKLVKE